MFEFFVLDKLIFGSIKNIGLHCYFIEFLFPFSFALDKLEFILKLKNRPLNSASLVLFLKHRINPTLGFPFVDKIPLVYVYL